MYVEKNKCKHKQTDNVIRYSIHIKVVTLYGEEKENEQTERKKETKKEKQADKVASK